MPGFDPFGLSNTLNNINSARLQSSLAGANKSTEQLATHGIGQALQRSKGIDERKDTHLKAITKLIEQAGTAGVLVDPNKINPEAAKFPDIPGLQDALSRTANASRAKDLGVTPQFPTSGSHLGSDRIPYITKPQGSRDSSLDMLTFMMKMLPIIKQTQVERTGKVKGGELKEGIETTRKGGSDALVNMIKSLQLLQGGQPLATQPGQPSASAQVPVLSPEQIGLDKDKYAEFNVFLGGILEQKRKEYGFTVSVNPVAIPDTSSPTGKVLGYNVTMSGHVVEASTPVGIDGVKHPVE